MTLWLRISAIILALAVVFGAFGAHGLKDILSDYSKDVYEKAVFYHFVHGLGMLLICLVVRTQAVKVQTATKLLALMLFGVVLFSGSLYILAITELRWLGAITPIGGSAFILAWLWLAYSFDRKDEQ